MIYLFRSSLAAALLIGFAGPAAAHDWYQINHGATQCVDITQTELESGAGEPGTPEAVRALYESLGETVGWYEISDKTGAPMVVLPVTDSSGVLFQQFVFFPTADACHQVLQEQPTS